MSWRLDHRSQARLSGALHTTATPRFPPSVVVSIDGRPAFSTPTRRDGGEHRFDVVLGSWIPWYSETLALSAPGEAPVSFVLAELDAEPPLLRSHIDCVTGRSIIGWGFWTEPARPIERFEVFVDFLPVEASVRRWRRDDLAERFGTDAEICFEIGFPSDLNGSTVSIRGDGACALFKTEVRPSYFLGEVKRLHRGAMAVVGVSPVHEAGARLNCGGRVFPQLAYPSALGVGGDGAAFFVVPADLLADGEQAVTLVLPSQPESYAVSRP